jgi:hypothetical protein
VCFRKGTKRKPPCKKPEDKEEQIKWLHGNLKAKSMTVNMEDCKVKEAGKDSMVNLAIDAMSRGGRPPSYPGSTWRP